MSKIEIDGGSAEGWSALKLTVLGIITLTIAFGIIDFISNSGLVRDPGQALKIKI